MERSQSLLITGGFDGVGVADIVAAAGVPKGSFYNHFPSKEQFAVEHVQRYVSSLGFAALCDPEGSALDAVRDHFANQVIARRDGSMPMGCLLGTLSSGISAGHANLERALQDGFHTWIDALAGALAAARDAGEIPPDLDPRGVAAALVDAFEGAVARSRVTHEHEPLTIFLQTTLPALIRSEVASAADET